MKIGLLSNVNISMLLSIMDKSNSYYFPDGYNTWVQEVLNKESNLYKFSPNVVFVILHGDAIIEGYSSLEEKKNEIVDMITYIAELSDNLKESAVFVSTIDISKRCIRPVSETIQERIIEWEWFNRLSELIELKQNLFIFDLKELIEDTGRNEFYSRKMWYMGGIPFSLKGFKQIAKCINQYLKAYKGEKLKCIAVDLDNTMWGGVIGEDGINGIKLADTGEGAIYRDLQKRLLELKETGAMIAILSKNNEDDVNKVIENHASMVLKNQDFILKKVNWNNKSDNLIDIARDLNIGLASFAFFDDNPAEREQMKAFCPEVTIIDFPKDSSNLEKVLIDAYKEYFFTLRATKEDAMKSQMYVEEQERKKLMKSSVSIRDYIRALGINIDIHLAKSNELVRVAQLTQKTNQFNLTTRRYTLDQIKKISQADDWRIYVAETSDRYGSNGLVFVSLIQKIGEEAYIDTLLMSCRVMGRYIENAVMDKVLDDLAKWGCNTIFSEYIKTDKNSPVENLFEKLSFEILSENEIGKKYKLEIDRKIPFEKIHESVKLNGVE